MLGKTINRWRLQVGPEVMDLRVPLGSRLGFWGGIQSIFLLLHRWDPGLLPNWLLRRKIRQTILCYLINPGPGINKLFLPTHGGKTMFYLSVSNGAFGGQKTDGFGPILGLFEGMLDWRKSAGQPSPGVLGELQSKWLRQLGQLWLSIFFCELCNLFFYFDCDSSKVYYCNWFLPNLKLYDVPNPKIAVIVKALQAQQTV